MTTNRKLYAVPVGAVAVFLAAASTAYACTVFKGDFKVKGDASANVVVARGNNSGMGWTSMSPDRAQATAGTGNITVSTDDYSYQFCSLLCQSGLAPEETRTSKLRSGVTYYVNFYNGDDTGGLEGFTDHDTWKKDCMGAGDPNTTSITGVRRLGTATVDSNGNLGSASGGTYNSTTKEATFSLPSYSTANYAAGSVKEAAVCISDSAENDGNQAPLTLV